MKQVISVFALSAATLLASCTSYNPNERDSAIMAKQATIDSMKMELAKQRIVDSMNEVAEMEYAALQEEKEQSVAAARSSSRSSAVRRSSSSSASNYSSYTGAGYSSPQPVVYQEAPRKRGWSAKAKGAVIGAGTGAVSGAVINKRDRVKGAVIGGVLGAGVGTGVGAIIDKKNGR